MKVLHVIDSLGGGGGAEQALRLQLPGLAQRGIESTVVCLRTRQGPLADVVRAEGTPVSVLTSSGRAAAAWELRRTIRIERPDLVHATLFDSCLVSRLAVPRGMALVNSLVNTSYAPIRVEQLGSPRVKRRVVRTVDRVTARRVTRFHALTHAVAQDSTRALHVDPSRITVIPRGRSLTAIGTRSQERRTAVRQRLGIRHDDFVIVNVGRQDVQKAQSLLVGAFSEVRKELDHAVLVIVGREGTATAGIAEAIASTGTADAVRLLGHRTDAVDILAAADVFAFPSYFEGLGSVLIEAMALGMPIVASDVPAIAEVLDNGAAGRLVPVGDEASLAEAIVDLASDPDSAEMMAVRGYRRFLGHYELDLVVDRTVAMYAELTLA